IVPWLAQTDASGNLLWQHFYYQTSTAGRPLSEDFQATAAAPGGGFLAIGPTLNYSTQKNQLYAVHTDSSGLAGTCADVHPATPLQAINPKLTAVTPSLPPAPPPPYQPADHPPAHAHKHPARLLTQGTSATAARLSRRNRAWPVRPPGHARQRPNQRIRCASCCKRNDLA